MDLIGAVPMDKDQHMRIFAQMQEGKYGSVNPSMQNSQNRIQNLTSIERKEKILGFVNDQRKHIFDAEKEAIAISQSRSTLEGVT